jgi:hypothetical protein
VKSIVSVLGDEPLPAVALADPIEFTYFTQAAYGERSARGRQGYVKTLDDTEGSTLLACKHPAQIVQMVEESLEVRCFKLIRVWILAEFPQEGDHRVGFRQGSPQGIPGCFFVFSIQPIDQKTCVFVTARVSLF